MEALVDKAPSMIGCTKLTVKGPVRFVEGTTLKGVVELVNESSVPVMLKPGVYENTKELLTMQ
jgi:uncharacterized protein YkvS